MTLDNEKIFVQISYCTFVQVQLISYLNLSNNFELSGLDSWSFC